VRKIVLILLLSTAVLVALAALADPTIRYPYIGVQLERDLGALEGTDPLTVMLSVETGVEILSEDQLDEEPVVQDDYTLLMILREELKVQNETATVTYDVEEMESEQWAWQEAKLNEVKARTQVSPRDLASAPQMTVPSDSVMASQEVWTPLVTSFWPKLPSGFQRAGKSNWQEQLSFEQPHPLTGQPVKVNYNLVYRLDKFVNTEQGILANILVLGSIAEGSEVDPSVEVRGTFKGFVLIEPDTGRAYGGEYRVEERFMVKQRGAVVRRNTFQGARFWRPMFYKMSQQQIPEGDATQTDADSQVGVSQ
jgi:DNA-directed RNA polymerase subunit L